MEKGDLRGETVREPGDAPALGEVVRHRAGARDRRRPRGAVRDDDGAAQPEQRRPAVGLRGVTAGHHPQFLGPGDTGTRHQRQCGPYRPLDVLEHHVPGETVGDDHIDGAREHVVSLHVAVEAQRQPGEQLAGPAGQPVALSRFRADRQQAHRRVDGAEHEPRVGGAEQRELGDHLRGGVRGRPGVGQHRRAAGDRGQRDGQGGPQDARGAPDAVDGARDDRARGTGRHERRRRPLPYEIAADRQAGRGGEDRSRAPLGHRDDVLGVHHVDLTDGSVPGELGTDGSGTAHEHHGDLELAPGHDRPGDRLGRSVVSAHRVDGHRL